jgi:hypothetical protein
VKTAALGIKRERICGSEDAEAVPEGLAWIRILENHRHVLNWWHESRKEGGEFLAPLVNMAI